MLSHDNIYFEVNSTVSSISYEYGGGIPFTLNSEERGVAYLPLSHVAGQIVYIFWPIWMMQQHYTNCKIYFARYSWKQTLKNTISYAQPTTFFGVPRVWEKFYEAMNAGLANASPLKKALFDWIVSNGNEFWENRQLGCYYCLLVFKLLSSFCNSVTKLLYFVSPCFYDNAEDFFFL